MAITTETVVVNLKVVGEGFDKTTKVLDQVGKTAKSVDGTFTSLGKAIKNTGKAIVTITGFFRIFNSVTAGSTGILGVLRQGTTAWTGAVNKAVTSTASFASKALPALTGAFLALAPAIGAALLINKFWNESLDVTEKGADRVATASNTLTIIYDSLRNAVSSVSDKVFDLAIGMGEAYEKTGLLAKVTGLMVRLLTSMGAEAIKAAKSINNLLLIQTEGSAQLKQDLAIINTQLKNQNIDDKERVRLLGERALAEGAIQKAQIPLLKSKKELLEVEAKTAKFARKVEITQELAELDDRIATANNSAANSLARAGIEINNILSKKKEIAAIDEAPTPESIELDTFVDDGLDQFVTKGQEISDILKGIQAEFNQDVIDGFEAIEEEGEEHVDEMSAQGRKAAENRIRWQQLGADGQLAIFGNLAGSLAEGAKNNFELQKGFAIAEAILNGAAAQVKVWRDPGYPIAIPLSAALAANTIGQINTIKNTQAGQTGTPLNPINVRTQAQPRSTESTSPNFGTPQQDRRNTQVVLVTEDLNTVQNRVQVTEDRATI